VRVAPSVPCDALRAMKDEAGFLGDATFYQAGAKVEVYARRYWAEDSAGRPCRWWGYYVVAKAGTAAASGGTTVANGAAYARFSDGSEADIAIKALSNQAGRFDVLGTLADSTTRPRPDI
jgi:hypothetical protein